MPDATGVSEKLIRSFHQALGLQSLVVIALAVAVLAVWHRQRSAALHGAPATPPLASRTDTAVPSEPPARRLLRLGFGALWLFDGFLQTQASMPQGLATDVVRPASNGSPGWVMHLVHWASQVWIGHPASLASGVVWVQAGIGAWMLVASRGPLSRLAGAVSVGWGLVIWVIGESLSGLLAPGLSVLTGFPGAILYVVAGALVAAPDRIWSAPAAGRLMLRCAGGFLVSMAILQAWPGRGYWGRHLADSARDMASMTQPALLQDLIRSSADFFAGSGWLVNLIAVVALAGIGAALASLRPGPARAGLLAAVLLGLADWVFVQDLGFVGGLGTDPNSMPPLILILAAGYLALVSRPAPTASSAPSALHGPPASYGPPASCDLTASYSPPAPYSPPTYYSQAPTATAAAVPRVTVPAAATATVALRRAAGLACVAVVLLGAVPMLVAAA